MEVPVPHFDLQSLHQIKDTEPPADPHDLDGVADHVGGALLAFRSS